ncbi:MAG: GNAT family N-acetyltransferase [Fimbriimonadaceae bacterium]|nr:GNAT family N-acetyltransferase [Fimbriimonadaceae bacterium]
MHLASLFPPPTIEAERVLLRPIAHKDRSALYEIFSDKRVMEYWSSVPYTSIEQADQLIAHIQTGYKEKSFLQLGIEHRKDQRLIGTATLHAIQTQCSRAELGYALHPNFWGQGLMHEALIALIGYAFDEANLLRIEADIEPNNVASAKALIRLGFKKEGYFPSRWIVNGIISDSEMYGLVNPHFKL